MELTEKIIVFLSYIHNSELAELIQFRLFRQRITTGLKPSIGNTSWRGIYHIKKQICSGWVINHTLMYAILFDVILLKVSHYKTSFSYWVLKRKWVHPWPERHWRRHLKKVGHWNMILPWSGVQRINQSHTKQWKYFFKGKKIWYLTV